MSKCLRSKSRDCLGCRNNFYNRGDSFCWSLEGAKKVKRWRINLWTPMDSRSRFKKVTVFNCYHGEGNQRDVFMARLPAHLGGDWADPKDVTP